MHYYTKNQNAAYFLMPNRFWEMAAGCLTFIGICNKIKFIDYLRKLNSNVIFLLLICSFLIPLNFAIPATISIVLLTVLIIISIKPHDFTYTFLTNKFILKIGLMSYSLYLWHWSIISLSEWTIGIYWWTIPFQGMLIFLISLLSYKFIEKPFRNFDYKNKLKSFFSGTILILLGQTIILYLGTSGKRLLFAGDISGIYSRNLISRPIFLSECNLIRNNFETVLLNKNCNTSMNSAKKRIFIVGDSRANMFLYPFKTIAKNNYALITLTGNECSFPVLKDNSFNASKICSSEMIKVEEWIIDNIKSGDIIFIANATFNDQILDFYSTKETNIIGLKYENYLSTLNELSEKVTKKGGSIKLLLNGPKFNGVTDAYCSHEWFRPKRFIKKECFLERGNYEESRNKVINYLLNNKNNNIYLIYDYLDFICNKNMCNASGYTDSNHIIEDLGLKILIREGF